MEARSWFSGLFVMAAPLEAESLKQKRPEGSSRGEGNDTPSMLGKELERNVLRYGGPDRLRMRGGGERERVGGRGAGGAATNEGTQRYQHKLLNPKAHSPRHLDPDTQTKKEV